MERLAFGNRITIVTTNVGALAEQVPLGTGFVVNIDKESIANKINEIYSMEFSEFDKINEKAYQYALRELTWESSILKLLNILK